MLKRLVTDKTKNYGIYSFMISVVLFVVCFQLIFSFAIVQNNLFKIFFYYLDSTCGQIAYDVNGYTQKIEDILIDLSLDNNVKQIWINEDITSEQNNSIKQLMNMYFYSDLLVEDIYLYKEDKQVVYDYQAVGDTKEIDIERLDNKGIYLYDILTKEPNGNRKRFDVYMKVSRLNYIYALYAVYYPFGNSKDAIVIKCNSSVFREKVEAFNIKDSGVFIIDNECNVMYTNYVLNNSLVEQKSIFKQLIDGDKDYIYNRSKKIFLIKHYSHELDKWLIFVVDGKNMYMNDNSISLYYYLILLIFTVVITLIVIRLMGKKIKYFIYCINDDNRKKYESYVLNSQDRNNFSKILVGPSSVDVEKEIKNMGLKINLKNTAMMLISLCDYDKLINKFENEKEVVTYKYTVIQVINEMLGKFFVVEGFSMATNKILYFVENKTEGDVSETELKEAMQLIHSTVLETMDVDFITVVSKVKTYRDIPALFSKISDIERYEWVYGNGSVVIYDDSASPDSNMPENEIGRLIEILKEYMYAEKIDDAINTYEELKAKIKYYRVDKIKMQMILLVNVFYELIIRLAKVFGYNYSIDILGIIESIQNADSYDRACAECDTVFAEMIKPIAGEKKISSNSEKICSSVVSLVENEYSKDILCLEYIADKLGKSPNYINKIFLQGKKETIPKYILNYRINMACVLLKESDLSIKEISAKVGIVNNSYFGKAFKKQMGVTPNKYREKYNKNDN